MLESLTQNLSIADDDDADSFVWPFSEPTGLGNSFPSTVGSAESSNIPTNAPSNVSPLNVDNTYQVNKNEFSSSLNGDSHGADEIVENAEDDIADEITPFRLPARRRGRNDSAASTISSSGVLTMQFSTSSQNSYSSSSVSNAPNGVALSSSSSASNFGVGVASEDFGSSGGGGRTGSEDVDDGDFSAPSSTPDLVDILARASVDERVSMMWRLGGESLPTRDETIEAADNGGIPGFNANENIGRISITQPPFEPERNSSLLRDITGSDVAAENHASGNEQRFEGPNCADNVSRPSRGLNTDGEDIRPDNYVPLSPPTSPSDVTLAHDLTPPEEPLEEPVFSSTAGGSSSEPNIKERDLSLPRPLNGFVSADR